MTGESKLPTYMPYPRFMLMTDFTQIARLLYSLLLDRATLSQKNGMADEQGRLLWSSIFVTLMANKIGGLQFGIYRNCQISSRVFHTAVAALPLTKANRSDFE